MNSLKISGFYGKESTKEEIFTDTAIRPNMLATARHEQRMLPRQRAREHLPFAPLAGRRWPQAG
jgi:hypothetical protein